MEFTLNVIFLGLTASGIFSKTVATTKFDDPRVKSPDSAESKALPSDDNVSHQERIKITDSNRELITYSKERSYSESQEWAVKNQGALHAFTIALALSVHSIFEGLAFGLQDTVNQVCTNTYTACMLVCK